MLLSATEVSAIMTCFFNVRNYLVYEFKRFCFAFTRDAIEKDKSECLGCATGVKVGMQFKRKQNKGSAGLHDAQAARGEEGLAQSHARRAEYDCGVPFNLSICPRFQFGSF